MKKKIVMWINFLVGFISFIAWIYMVLFGNDGGALSSNRLSSLKYFTVLSNLLNGFVSLIVAWMCPRQKEISHRISILKLVSTTAVTLTFLTILLFLGPVWGYATMYTGANFWMHLILPIASVISYVALEDHMDIMKKEVKYVMVSTLLYEIGYVTNLILNGIGEFPESNDFYGFMTWGYGVAAIIAIVILLVTWCIGYVLQFSHRKVHAH